MNIQLEHFLETCTTAVIEEKRWWPAWNENCLYKMTYEEYITNSEYSIKDMALVFHGSYERSDDSASLTDRKKNAIS